MSANSSWVMAMPRTAKKPTSAHPSTDRRVVKAAAPGAGRAW
jgi:hypothetical protein